MKDSLQKTKWRYFTVNRPPPLLTAMFLSRFCSQGFLSSFSTSTCKSSLGFNHLRIFVLTPHIRGMTSNINSQWWGWQSYGEKQVAISPTTKESPLPRCPHLWTFWPAIWNGVPQSNVASGKLNAECRWGGEAGRLGQGGTRALWESLKGLYTFTGMAYRSPHCPLTGFCLSLIRQASRLSQAEIEGTALNSSQSITVCIQLVTKSS